MVQGAASIWVGWDPREFAPYTVAKSTLRANLNLPIPIRGLILEDLRRQGLYQRPMEFRLPRGGVRPVMWDVLSEAPMSTQHANSRFLVPHLAGSGWAMFIDGDIMVRKNLTHLFSCLDPRFAVYCVKHVHHPDQGIKMDGQVQTNYGRKNWSSMMIFNCDHPSNKRLTLEMINTVPGRDLHRFCWLEDDEIGELSPTYNFLVDYYVRSEQIDPIIVHFTSGTPDMPGYENCDFADEWRVELMRHVV